MKHTRLADLRCPIARTLDVVGEWWSLLILRDAMNGIRRFDGFQASLGVAPNILSRRLAALVAAGLLERRLYCPRPPRYEYVLTEAGRDLRPVLLTLMAWGNRHAAPEGPYVQLVEAASGRPVEPVLTDPATGRPITGPDFVVDAGPAAPDDVRARFAERRARRQHTPQPDPLPTLTEGVEP